MTLRRAPNLAALAARRRKPPPTVRAAPLLPGHLRAVLSELRAQLEELERLALEGPEGLVLQERDKAAGTIRGAGRVLEKWANRLPKEGR